MPELIATAEWFYLVYYATLHAAYLLLFGAAAYLLWRRRRTHHHRETPPVQTGLEPPVTVLVPLYNEVGHLETVISTLRGQHYRKARIILINDGSTDETMERLDALLELEPHDLDPARPVASEPVEQVYRSGVAGEVVVLDKANGGKSDALNAGLQFVEDEFICVIDGDSRIGRDSLGRSMIPFLEKRETLLVGGTLGVLNGCEVDEQGYVRSVRAPGRFVESLQTLEYLRSFLFSRLGWTALGALPLVSGAFATYRMRDLLAAGGFRDDTHGEDLEATLRLHRHARTQGRPYRIDFLADVACWTRVPTTWRTLADQRAEWHKSLTEDLIMNRGLLRTGGVAGWLMYPFQVLFEWCAPVAMWSGFLLVAVALLLGIVSWAAVLSLSILVVGIGLLLSALALLLETATTSRFHRPSDLVRLYLTGLAELFGYRQLHALWQLRGLGRWWKQGAAGPERDRMLRRNLQEEADGRPDHAETSPSDRS